MFPLPASMGLVKPPSASYDTSPVTKIFASASQYAPGGGYTSWNNPSNAGNSGSPADVSDGDFVSYYLRMSNGGFNLPPTATITNIKYETWCYYTDTTGGKNTMVQDRAYVLKGGSETGNNLGPNTVLPLNTAAFMTVNDTLANWGATLSASDVNASDFGYSFGVGSTYTGLMTGYVYYTQCTITFT